MKNQDNQIISYIAQLTEAEKANLLLYFSFYEKHRLGMSEWAEQELLDHPAWGMVIQELAQNEKAKLKQREESYQLQKDAIVNGEWEPYLEYLNAFGIAYARVGLDFHSWFELVNMIRRYLTPFLLKLGDTVQALNILNGMDVFMDIVMSHIGEAYLYEKKRIIEQQKYEQELLNKELEQFVYIASHDLQEPLTTISSFVRILEEEYGDNFSGEPEEFLQYIKESAARMSMLITGLLEYSRIGNMSPQKEVDLNKVLEEVQADLKATINKHQAKVIVPDNLPTLYVSPVDIKLLFQNLIANSIKFSKKGQLPVVELTGERCNGQWHFSVKDNGIGIAKKDQDKIFTIFKRLHGESDYKGTGIGLSHCKKIVETLDGKIWVESELGQGSTFHFTIDEKRTI